MGSMFKTFRPSERCFVSEGSLTQQRSLTLQHIFRKQAVIEVKKKNIGQKNKNMLRNAIPPLAELNQVVFGWPSRSPEGRP